MSKAISQDTTPRPSPPFPFLSLPPEIRTKIYLLLLTSPSPIPLTPSRSLPSDPFPPPPQQDLFFPYDLQLTCHQLYHETRGLYFAHNTFSITLSRFSYSSLSYFLAPPFRDNRRRIRSLHLRIYRWGARNAFVQDVAPVLEDMVLNGALRVLEVGVRWTDLFGNSGRRGMGKSSGTAAEEWRRSGIGVNMRTLVRICEDPYLERVRLVGYQTDLPWEALCDGFDDAKSKDVTYLLDRKHWVDGE